MNLNWLWLWLCIRWVITHNLMTGDIVFRYMYATQCKELLANCLFLKIQLNVQLNPLLACKTVISLCWIGAVMFDITTRVNVPHTGDQTIIDFSVVNSRQGCFLCILKTPPLKTQEALFVTQHYKNSLYMFAWSNKSIIQMLFQRKISIHSKEYWSVAVCSKVEYLHDDIMTWKHFLHNWPFVNWIHQSLGQWCWVLLFSLLLTWIRCWINGRVGSDLRCLDSNVMPLCCCQHGSSFMRKHVVKTCLASEAFNQWQHRSDLY